MKMTTNYTSYCKWFGRIEESLDCYIFSIREINLQKTEML